MPKSKKRKNHKSKVAKRNSRKNDMQNFYKKRHKRVIDDVIAEEKRKGKFENNKDISTGSEEGPSI